jgi:hypothetical protein
MDLENMILSDPEDESEVVCSQMAAASVPVRRSLASSAVSLSLSLSSLMFMLNVYVKV